MDDGANETGMKEKEGTTLTEWLGRRLVGNQERNEQKGRIGKQEVKRRKERTEKKKEEKKREKGRGRGWTSKDGQAAAL